MTNRNPLVVFLLNLVTLGIYNIFWLAKSRGEMNSLGADVPTTWLIIVPFVNFWYLWKFGAGVDHVTGGKLSGVVAFLVLLIGNQFFIGSSIVQDSFNKVQAPAAANPEPPTQPAV